MDRLNINKSLGKFLKCLHDVQFLDYFAITEFAALHHWLIFPIGVLGYLNPLILALSHFHLDDFEYDL